MTKYVIVLPFPAGTKGVDNYHSWNSLDDWGILKYAAVFGDKEAAIEIIRARIKMGGDVQKWKKAVVQSVAWEITIIGNKEKVTL